MEAGTKGSWPKARFLLVHEDIHNDMKLFATLADNVARDDALKRIVLGCGRGTAKPNLTSNGTNHGGPRRERRLKNTFL
jgi:hypothetical protein